jgi:DNA (cytosine-5)-methyltransferase 1
MEIGIMNGGVHVIQSLDLDSEATDCMLLNRHYFSHDIINADIKGQNCIGATAY